jgi:hypothetical protein
VLGYYNGRPTAQWDEGTQAAFVKFVNESNFENKLRTDGLVWPTILDHLTERADLEVARRTRTAPQQTGALSKGPGMQPGGNPSKPEKAPKKGRSG